MERSLRTDLMDYIRKLEGIANLKTAEEEADTGPVMVPARVEAQDLTELLLRWS